MGRLDFLRLVALTPLAKLFGWRSRYEDCAHLWYPLPDYSAFASLQSHTYEIATNLKTLQDI